MNSRKQILTVLACLLICASFAVAQEHHFTRSSRDTASRDVTVIIQQRQLHFAAQASALELGLEVYDNAGESVYDSRWVTGQELSWDLRNKSGEAVPSGLYVYTLTVKEAKVKAPTVRRGHLIIESAGDRIWVTNQGSIGANESLRGETGNE